MVKKIRRILLVDDNEIDNILSNAIIKPLEITEEIIPFINGKEVLHFIKNNCNSGLQNNHNLILLDINMPVMDGFKFLEEFNKIEKKENFMVVMLSSSNNSKDKERSFRLNASHYLEKPLNKEKLLYIIQKWCN